MTTPFPLETSDGVTLQVRRWLPPGAATAVVVIAHGMAEHTARYERFAGALTAAGYAVYAADHRGHGETAASGDVGYFADTDGWDKVVEDIALVVDRARSDNPGLPVVLLGHSMGSMLARAYAARHGQDLAALVLSGTSEDPGMLGRVGRVVATVEGRLRGRRRPSPLMNKLTFGQFNAAFKPARTDFDWLSRDPAEVDKYVADPRCGAVFSSGFFADMLGGLARLHRDEDTRIPHSLPVLFVSGEEDPVGGKRGTGVIAVADQLRRNGVADVTVRLYPGARHELLNETNRDEVTADLLAWIGQHLPQA